MSNSYNTQQEAITLKEYGRNIQNIAKYVVGIEDKEARTSAALKMAELMKQLKPALKESPEYEQKIWNDINIISGYELNVEHPKFDTPLKHEMNTAPARVPYPGSKIKYKHYGKSLELLIEQAAEIEDPEEKEQATVYIARVMKRFFETWNKDNVENEVIIEQLSQLSRRKLNLDLETVQSENLLNIPTIRDNKGGHKRRNNRNQGNNRNKRKRS